jgi:hypothetical protein
MSRNASEEFVTELSVGDLKNIAVLINAVKDKELIGNQDAEILTKISDKITAFLNSIDEPLLTP